MSDRALTGFGLPSASFIHRGIRPQRARRKTGPATSRSFMTIGQSWPGEPFQRMVVDLAAVSVDALGGKGGHQAVHGCLDSHSAPKRRQIVVALLYMTKLLRSLPDITRPAGGRSYSVLARSYLTHHLLIRLPCCCDRSCSSRRDMFWRCWRQGRPRQQWDSGGCPPTPNRRLPLLPSAYFPSPVEPTHISNPDAESSSCIGVAYRRKILNQLV